MARVSNKTMEIMCAEHNEREKPHIDYVSGFACYWWSKNRELDVKVEEFCIKLNEQRDTPSTKGA